MATYNPQQTFSYTGGPYGSQPAPVNLPNPSADLSNLLPGLGGTNNQLSGVINSELSGTVSPDVLNQLQDKSAAFGVSVGQPAGGGGNSLSLENLLAGIGVNSQSQQQAGVSNYNQTVPTISSTQTLNPALQFEANTQNAVNAAAPNPTAAANQEMSLLQQYLKELENPSSGSGSPLDATNQPPQGESFAAAGQNPGDIHWSANPPPVL
jgi:hypothetical protein